MTHRYRDIRPIYRTKGWPLRGALFIPCSSKTSPPKALNEKKPVDRVYRVFSEYYASLAMGEDCSCPIAIAIFALSIALKDGLCVALYLSPAQAGHHHQKP